MIANYHSHTWRCGHAEGTEREYVEAAIEGGLKILGFSDHAPMPFPNGYTSRVRMGLKQLEEYVNVVLALKEEYSNDIEIHLGMEAEYFPALHERFLEIIKDYPVEYLLLGQHYLGDDAETPYVADPTADEELLKLYTKRCMEAIDTGCFSYVAHPDVFWFNGDRGIYEKWSRELCEHAAKKKLPLEINFLGIGAGRHYPNKAFWKVVGEVGNDVIFGSDAHRPENVWRPDVIGIAQQMVADYHLHLVDTVQLVSPFQKNG